MKHRRTQPLPHLQPADLPIRCENFTRALRYALNPALFAAEVLEFQPDPIQTRILENHPHRLIVNGNRQFGKSTMAAILAAHRAIFKPGSLSIILGPSERQSGETLLKVEGFLNQAGVRTASDRVNRCAHLLPANGSRIVALPSTDAKIRGFSKVSLLIIDEASRVADPLYYALRPSLAVSNGDIVIVSTPLGKRGFFYTEFTNPKNAAKWERITAPVSACPRIPKEFLEEERLLGEEYFAQEYECQFVEDGRFLFTDADIRKLYKSDIEPLKFDRTDPTWNCVMKPVRG
jgi:hypothetical protein